MNINEKNMVQKIKILLFVLFNNKWYGDVERPDEKIDKPYLIRQIS